MDDIPKIGITGMPNVGKTQTLKKIIGFMEADGYVSQGMITEPILNEKNERIGFNIQDYQTKEKGVFAHIDFEEKEKVGKYGVDISVL
jgi:nucleoside-triphosphatase THEP1